MNIIGNDKILDDDELEVVPGGAGIPNGFALWDSVCGKNTGGGHNWVMIRNLYRCSNCTRICKDRTASDDL